MANIIRSRLLEGVWRAEVTDLEDPDGVEATLREYPIDGVEVTLLREDTYVIQVPIPAWALSDGAHSVIISSSNGEEIGNVSIVAGTAVADDLRAEVSLLRAELDMLKKAYRKQFLTINQ